MPLQKRVMQHHMIQNMINGPSCHVREQRSTYPIRAFSVCRQILHYGTLIIVPDKKGRQTNIFFYFSTKTCCGYSLEEPLCVFVKKWEKSLSEHLLSPWKCFFFYLTIKCGNLLEYLAEALLMSTHNICLCREIRNIYLDQNIFLYIFQKTYVMGTH